MNTKRKTPILLVEDNPGDVKLIEIQLIDAAMRCDLFVAATLDEADDRIQRHDIDLVLLDLSLPDSNGFKTLTDFMDRHPGFPVIVLTGNSNEIIGNQSIRAGAQDFLVKGQFDGKQLGRSIRYALQRHQTQVELERTARDLELSKQRHAEAQAMAKFGNWEMDLVTNRMTWTLEIYNIFDFSPGQSHSKSTYLEHTHPDDRERVQQFLADASKDGKLHRIEHRLVVRGTQIRWVNVHARVQYNDISKKLTLLGGMQDITERKLSEQLMEEKNISGKAERIRQDSLQDLAFQVRTPLSTITNLLFLLEQSRLGVQQTEFVGDLKTSVDDLSISINNLLNFSVLASDELEVERAEVDPKNLIDGIRRVLKLKADKRNIELLVEQKNLPKTVFADSNKLTQILFNLVDNAIRYSEPGDRVTIGAQVKEAGRNSELVLMIRDTGPGIVSEKLKELQSENLLRELSAADRDPNAPLGMAIVAKLVSTLGGGLRMESEPGLGSVFTVNVPVKVPRTVPMKILDKPETPLRILMVEDHALNQVATKRVLTAWSDLVSVDIADNGAIGVQKFNQGDYDLVLMDLQMPVMNGLESAKRIRRNSAVPIIALSANSTKQEQDRCFEIGMNDYLQKPFKPKDLYEKIMRLRTMILQ